MALTDFRKLDRRKVEISIPINSRRIVVSGFATLFRDPEGEESLKVDVEDPAGAFEIVLPSGAWANGIQMMEASDGVLIVLGSQSKRPELADAGCGCGFD
jgi:hypothetical protein